MTNKSSASDHSEDDETTSDQAVGDDVVSSAIGQRLKKLYQDVEEEPVPDKFLQLLDKLGGQQPNSESD